MKLLRLDFRTPRFFLKDIVFTGIRVQIIYLIYKKIINAPNRYLYV